MLSAYREMREQNRAYVLHTPFYNSAAKTTAAAAAAIAAAEGAVVCFCVFAFFFWGL